MAVSREKFLKHRNALIAEVVEEMGEDAARRYFETHSHREAIEKIAENRAFWEPTRDLSSGQFREGKWKKNRPEEA